MTRNEAYGIGGFIFYAGECEDISIIGNILFEGYLEEKGLGTDNLLQQNGYIEGYATAQQLGCALTKHNLIKNGLYNTYF